MNKSAYTPMLGDNIGGSLEFTGQVTLATMVGFRFNELLGLVSRQKVTKQDT